MCIRDRHYTWEAKARELETLLWKAAGLTDKSLTGVPAPASKLAASTNAPSSGGATSEPRKKSELGS